MVNINTMSDAQLRETALSIIARELGPVGLLRFLRQYEQGYGDYTEDREFVLKDETLDTIVERVEKKEKDT